MKLIFLDIDGVLNKKTTQSPSSCVLEEKQLALLAELVKKSRAKIILTSSWRLSSDEPWREPLLNAGISVTDKTARLNGNNRQREILLYLTEHGEVDSFVILDDQANGFGKLRGNRVLVDPRTGLTEENIAKALKILGV